LSNNIAIEKIIGLTSENAAPLLLGCTLNRLTPEGLISLKIVETEAYHQTDPASHSYIGLTTRTAPMFKEGGIIYIYFTYGMHYCINIVVGQAGVGEAVLLRAAEPKAGIRIMQKNRGTENLYSLANGPGKLAQVLGVKETKLSGKKLSKSTIWLEPSKEIIKPEDILTSPRIGISKAKDIKWRFYIKNNPFVSGYSRSKGI
jgi:DNA-3-methyladenine glycosylase